MKYYRIHTQDTAYYTNQPRGLFTAVWKLVEADILTEEEQKEYWKNREYFEKALPVPPFYADGNPDRAVTWFKNNENGDRIFEEMTFYKDMAKKYGVKLYISECCELPGEVVYEDDFQIAVKNVNDKAHVTTSELF